MTNVTGSRPFSHCPGGLRGSQEGGLFEEERFSLTDERVVLCDYDLLLDEQPDVGATARLAEHPESAGGEHPQELAAGDDDNARCRRAAKPVRPRSNCRRITPSVQSFRFVIATVTVSRSKFRLAHRRERTARQ